MQGVTTYDYRLHRPAIGHPAPVMCMTSLLLPFFFLLLLKDLIGLLQAQVKEQKTLIMELKIRLAMHEGTQQAGTAKGKAEGPPPLEGSEW